MIRSKNDLKIYMEEDLAKADYAPSIKSYLFNKIWRYLRILRKLEYHTNNRTRLVNKIFAAYYKLRLKLLGESIGFTIPPNVFGPGLSLPHVGTIVVNSKCKVGKNCRIHVCVNIGAGRYDDKAPVLGDDIYIGPGAKLFGNINIADGATIGANAVVNKSFSDKNATIAGVPAKIIKVA